MKVRYWVLEKVLAQSSTELDIINHAISNDNIAWVNTPRRLMFWHQKLKSQFSGKGPLFVTNFGGLWGLACNAIHFIDLVAWWSDESLVSVDTTGLDQNWFESKRDGYFEVTGKLVAHFSGGAILELNASSILPAKPLHVELSDGVSWEIDEAVGHAFNINGQQINGQIEFQSMLSGRLVDDILLRGRCNLPTLRESSAMHVVFLDAMLAHWNLSQNRKCLGVPIT